MLPNQCRLPFLDEPDLRYRNRVWKPEPIARAVMFCLMDVSASMDEDKKDLAKRFFTLLYLFLTRTYIGTAIRAISPALSVRAETHGPPWAE